MTYLDSYFARGQNTTDLNVIQTIMRLGLVDWFREGHGEQNVVRNN